jgi:SAM-dependent methyltransferase
LPKTVGTFTKRFPNEDKGILDGRMAAEEKSGMEFWEARWQSGETRWDHGRPSPPLVQYVEGHAPPAGKVLVPGAGGGHDAHYLAQYGALVTALDISPTALKRARQAYPHPGIRYVEGDLLQPDSDWAGSFDWIVEHTCLCALPPEKWPAYAASVHRLLRPGGHYLAVFYRRPHSKEGPPFGIHEDQILDLFGNSLKEELSLAPRLAYGSRFGREELRLFRKRA